MSDASKVFEKLKLYFDREICQRATAPLKNGIQVAVIVDHHHWSLVKDDGKTGLVATAAFHPDFTFSTTSLGIEELMKVTANDIGEIGLGILKLIAESDPEKRMEVKVHIGAFDLFRNGYLGVLPLGGPTVMKFLATKGFSNIGKIKEKLSQMRNR